MCVALETGETGVWSWQYQNPQYVMRLFPECTIASYSPCAKYKKKMEGRGPFKYFR